MFINDNGERYYNSRFFKASNGRNDEGINPDDLDLGGGMAPEKTPEQLAEEERTRIEKEKGGGTPDTIDLIKDVENDYIKGLDETKVTEVIEKYNGSGFDKDGNVIDAEGKVLKTPDEVKVDFEDDTSPLDDADEVTLEVDGKEVTYKLNDNKDAVDAEGNVVKTKDELLAMADDAEGADDDDYISSISSITGFQAVNENGEPVEFENTVEGLASREAHIVKQEAIKLAKNEINGFFDKNPDVVEMMNYKKIHGSLKDYATHEDYSKIVLDEANDDQHKTIIVKAEMEKGNSEERARKIADYLMEDGKGKEEAEASLKFLVDKQTADNAAAAKRISDSRQAELDAKREEFSKVAEVVKSGEVMGYKIPTFFKVKLPDGTVNTLHRNSLFTLITEPIDDNGTTRYDKMRANESVEGKVLDAYVKLVGYDVDTLVTQKANHKKVLDLKNKKKSASGKVNFHKSGSTIAAEDIK